MRVWQYHNTQNILQRLYKQSLLGVGIARDFSLLPLLYRASAFKFPILMEVDMYDIHTTE